MVASHSENTIQCHYEYCCSNCKVMDPPNAVRHGLTLPVAAPCIEQRSLSVLIPLLLLLYRFIRSNSILRGRRVALSLLVRAHLYAILFAGAVARLWNKEFTPLHGITCCARLAVVASQIQSLSVCCQPAHVE